MAETRAAESDRAEAALGSSRRNKRNVIIAWCCAAAAVLVLVPCYWFALVSPGAGLVHDDAIYMVTAKALAEGKGYRILSLPEETPQTKYPPLFPFLLSLVWRAAPSFPANVAYLRLVPFLCFVIWCGLTYRWLFDSLGARGSAAGIVLLTASSAWIWFYANSMWSEMPFCVLVAAAIVLFERMPEGRSSLAWAAGLGLLAGGAWLCRAAGVAVVAAAVLALLHRREFRLAAVAGLGAAAVVAPWYLHVISSEAVSNPFYVYYSAADYATQNVLTDYAFGDKAVIVATNLFLMVFSVPLAFGWEFLPLNAAAAAISAPLVAIGLGKELRARPDLKALILALSLGLHLMRAWPPPRYVGILLPFFLYYSYRGLEAVCSRRRWDGRAPGLGFAVACAAFAVSATQLVTVASAVPRTGVVWPRGYAGESWDGVLQTASFIKEKLPAGETVFSHSDPLVWLLTGRKAISYSTFSTLHLFYRDDAERGMEVLPLDLVDPSPPRYVAEITAPGIARLDQVLSLLDGKLAERGAATLLFTSPSGRSRVIVER